MALPRLMSLEVLLLEVGYRRNLTETAFISDGRDDLGGCVTPLLEGNFEGALLGKVATAILGSAEGGDHGDDAGDVVEFIQRGVRAYLEKSKTQDEDNSSELAVMCVGVACLQLFIQSNWTGPTCKVNPRDALPTRLSCDSNPKVLHDYAMSALSPDDTSVYSLVAQPGYLLMAHCILVKCGELLAPCLTAEWWAMRCYWVQQQLLDERSPQIHEEVHKLMNSISSNTILMDKEKCDDLGVIFHLECSHVCLYYYEYTLAREHLHTARTMTGLDVSLSGALGKRTRFQETEKAQLFLGIRREESAEGPSNPHKARRQAAEGLPKDLDLNDDTVLEAIKFQDPDAIQMPELSGSEQALVVALCLEHKRTRPRQELLLEELKAYNVAALRTPQVWSVQTQALSIRCHLEKDQGRRVERAMMQMQVLVDQFSGSNCAVVDRLALLHAVCLPPKWTMESQLASLLMSLGVVTAALEVYIRLELWEDVIKCYNLLEKPDKALKVIRDQLAVQETPTLWCMLGDLKKDKQYYEKAWEVSGQRNARAMRSLGLHYLQAEDWTKSIECLNLSLDRNPVQYDAWFWLGYSSNQAENYETAARAYRKCVTLENDNGRAWNNLSSALINLKKKPQAFKTLQEAIRCMYENWRIWENYMLVSVDVGEFKEAIRAFQRLLDLKDKYVEEGVLAVLVRAVTEDIRDADGNPAGSLKDKLVKLFGRLTSQVTSNARVWALYAKLHGNAETDNAESDEKALQCLQKAHRLCTQDSSWTNDVQSCKGVLAQSVQLAQAYSNCSNSKTDSTEAIHLLSSAKLMLKSIMSKIKKLHTEDSPTWVDLADPLTSAQSKLDRIVERIAERKGQQ